MKTINLTLPLFIVMFIISFESFWSLLFSCSALHSQPFKNKLQPLSRLTSAVQNFSLPVQLFCEPFSRSTSKIFPSHSAVRHHPFKNFLQPFSHSTYLVWTVCGPVSYPFTCRAFSHSNRYCKECFRVTGYIFVDCHGHCYDFYDRQMLLIWQVTDQVQIIFTKCGQILL